MSGLLGDVLRDALGGQQGGNAAALQAVLKNVLAGGQGQSGGLGALIARFEQAGLGDKAQSWVSNAPNQPVSPDEVGKVFSAQELQTWAQQAGTTPDKMKAVLAQALPHVVDQATPNGQVPAGTPDITGLLGKLL
jgi:uncharacterized protein YidB (DUF937 family)